MALEKQIVSLTLAKGMDTKTDSKQQVPGTLVLLENGRFTEPGKIRKRPGFVDLGQQIINSTETIEVGAGLTGFNNELLMSTGTKLYSFVESLNSWTSKGDLFNVTIDAQSVIRNDYSQTSQDACFHPSGLQCFVWEDSSGGSRYSIIDYDTKLQIVSNRIITSDATKPKAYAVGNYIVILYHDTSESNINALCIPISNPSGGGAVIDFAIDPADNVYDAQLIGTRLFLVYNDTAGDISIRYMLPNLVVSAAENLSSLQADSVAIFGDNSLAVWVALWDGTDVKVASFDYNLVPSLSITTVETIANVKNITGALVNGTAQIFYDVTASPVINYLIKKTTITNAGVVNTPNILIRSLALTGKAFVFRDVTYLLASFASDYQATTFVVNEFGQVATKLAPLVGGGIPAKNVIPQVNTVSPGVFQVTYLQKTTANAVNGLIISPTSVMQATLDFTSVGLISAELGDNLHVGGGFLAQYDGAQVVEHGFHLFPEAVSLAQSSGGSIANGTYQYVACYEWTDLAGNIHRSAPSIPTSITTTSSNQTVTVTIPTLRVTAKTGVVIHIYRTENGGSVFYRITSLTSPLFNNPAVDTVTYTDTAADASIIGNNQLYTTGGVVENIAAPASEIMTSFKNRMVIVPAENKNEWWYSKEVVPGLPAEFSDVFVNNMDQFGGDIRAVGVLDDKIIFFKETTKFFVYGDGPAANGAGGAFSFPERITGDTGCINQRSIVTTPLGLIYQSPKGIYLLNRALADEYIGSPVEAYAKEGTVTSAVLIANTNQVRLTMTTGITLVFDYYVNQWSIDTGLAAQDSALVQGTTYTIVRANGQVLRENGSVFTDAGRLIKMKMRTGWINFAQVNGFQRVYKMLLLGEYYSPHRLIVSIAENFNDNAHQQTYINANLLEPDSYGDDSTYGDSIYYGDEFPLYQFRIFFQRQKGTSIQITIDETQATNFGEGFSLSNIAFEVGVKRGLNKLKAGASYG